MKYEPNVKVAGVQPELLIAINTIDNVFYKLNVGEPECTSMMDGVHSENSYHYKGRALDLRIKPFMRKQKERIFNAIRSRLYHLGFDVIWEDKSGPNEHIHVEFDKRGEA